MKLQHLDAGVYAGEHEYQAHNNVDNTNYRIKSLRAYVWLCASSVTSVFGSNPPIA